MEMATDEPTPTASQQELSGSNTGHLTVDYDSDDATYRAQVDELVRTIESMPFVSKLSQLGAPRPGFQASSTCYAARGYKSCGCKQRKVVQLTQHRATLLACLQDLSQQLQASHGQNCIDAAHALAREQAAAAAASRPPARDENAMASMMHLAQIRSRLEAATKRAAQANAACLAAEREKDAAQQAVQELERELQSHCPKRARTAEQDDEPTEAVAEWDLSTFRREFTRVSGRRNIAITDRQHCLETRRGKYNFLNHPRLGLLGWMAYWSHGVQSIVVTMIVDLIKELGLGLQVIAGLPEGQEARAQAATNEHIVDRLKACLSELKHGQKRQTEEQRKQYIQILAAVMPVRARERDSAGWIRRVCERLDVSRGSRNARQYAAEKAIDLRAGFDQAVENSKRPLQEGDTVMAHGDVCVLKEISKELPWYFDDEMAWYYGIDTNERIAAAYGEKGPPCVLTFGSGDTATDHQYSCMYGKARGSARLQHLGPILAPPPRPIGKSAVSAEIRKLVCERRKGAGLRRVGGLPPRFTLSVADDNKFRALCE